MNKQRRKEIQSIVDQLEELQGSLEALKEEEEEYQNSIPENMQGSVRYENAGEAISCLEDAVSYLNDAICAATSAIE